MKKLKNKNLILMINTAMQNEMTVFLFDGQKINKSVARGQKDKLLSLIDKLARKNKKEIADITGIVVTSGPGSFTAVRQGAAAANALGFALRVPVRGVRLEEFKNDDELLKIGLRKLAKAKMGDIVLPFYGKEPNIIRARDPSLRSG
jgi:tRNA threonylcarbamoyladenosine biosynthesis protein TsaB